MLALSQALAAAVEQSGSSVVAIDARPRVHTSGVVWRENVIVSTNHTIRRDEAITVTLPDGEVLPAAVAGRDPGTDLAVLRMDGGKGTPARLADAAALKAGGLVLA
ncbi:MAG: trypsin-like peptidase domain-containing protein, partial [Pseudomonadota bacterium]